VARGAAFADYDGDGDLDVALSTNNGPAVLLRNDGGNANGWIRLRLVGTKSNRDAIGARVRLSASGRVMTRTVRAAASYASQSETTLTFGLGPAGSGGPGTIDVEVRWPGGQTQSFSGLQPGRSWVLQEGSPRPL